MLGNTGLKVSEIGMGCEGFAEDGYRMTKALFDVAEAEGINYFDLYTSNPDVRRAVGEAMKGRREKFLVQSHICSVWQDGQYKRTRKLDEVKAGFAEMMELLQTDYLDVGMIHYCDALSDWEEIVSGGVLDYVRELKAEGRIRHIGISSHNPQVALKAVESGTIEVLMFSVIPAMIFSLPLRMWRSCGRRRTRSSFSVRPIWMVRVPVRKLWLRRATSSTAVLFPAGMPALRKRCSTRIG